jgi:phosphatidylserine decarboxylase
MEKFSWSDPPNPTAFPIASPAYPLIFGGAFITVIFALLGMKIPALIGLVATAGVCGFFRDPDRVTPVEDGAVIAPADGKVIVVQIEEENPYIPGPCLKISIFMTVFNVHVNRIPHEGEVVGIDYRPGKFYSADKNDATMKNEQNAVMVQTKQNQLYAVVQVAGFVARRIICTLQAGKTIERGQRFGMICFGSRLDIYLPPNTEPKVTKGQKTRAGTTILGYLHETEK